MEKHKLAVSLFDLLSKNLIICEIEVAVFVVGLNVERNMNECSDNSFNNHAQTKFCTSTFWQINVIVFFFNIFFDIFFIIFVFHFHAPENYMHEFNIRF